MASNRETRRVLTRYTTYYLVLAVVSALLVLFTPIGLYILFIFSIPIAGSLAITLINSLKAIRGTQWLSGRQVNDAAYVALTLLMSLGAFLVMPIYAAKVALSSLILLAAAIMVHRLGSDISFTRFNVGDFIKRLSIAIALFSLAALLGLAYRPLIYPFAISALAALVLSPVSLINAQPSRGIANAILYLRDSYDSIVAAFFGLGLFYMALAIPKPPTVNTYILAVSVMLTLILVAYISYRAYSVASSNINKIIDEVYEAHRREIKVIQVPELKYFNEAIDDFIKYGIKDKLLVYLSYIMASGGFEYNEVLEVLSELINYHHSPSKLYDRFSIEAEVVKRINILNALLSAMEQYGEAKRVYQL